MKGNGDCEIENGKGATRKQGTECAVLLLQAFGNHQQCGAGQETKYGTQCFVNPVFINGIFYKEATPMTNTRIPILPKRFSPINFS